MALEDKDIPYAVDLYDRLLTQVTVDGRLLGEVLIRSRYNAWDVFSTQALFDDCATFSRTRSYDQVAHHYTQAIHGKLHLKAFFTGMGLWLMSKLAIVFLILGRQKVLVFSVDKESVPQYHADFRIGKIYQQLDVFEIGYVECFHTTLNRSVFGRAWRRKRVAVYLEGIDWLFFTLRAIRRVFMGRGPQLRVSGLDSFSDDEKKFVRALVQKYLSALPLVSFRIRVLSFALRLSGVALIVGIDDARQYHELSAAAQERNIPFYVYQHGVGHVTPYHRGWLRDNRLRGQRMRPSDLVVWNDYWKQEFKSLGSLWEDEHLHIGGNAKAVKGSVLKKGTPDDPVLIPFEVDAPRDLLRKYVAALEAVNVPVIFKLRPDVSVASQKKILEGVDGSVTYTTEVTQPISAIVGMYSTLLYEAVGEGVPAGLLMSPVRYGERLVNNGLYTAITLATLDTDLMALKNLSEREIDKRKQVAVSEPFEPFFERILREHRIV